MNKLETMVSELSLHYGIPAKEVDVALRKALHDGMHILVAECLFIDVMNQHAVKPLHRTYSTEDIMDATGMTRQEVEAEIERVEREHPDKVTGYIFPASLFKAKPAGDFRPHPDDPEATLVNARGVIMIVLLEEKEGTGTPKTAKITRRLFEIVAGNGYHLDAQPLQREIMARNTEDIKSWIRAVYDVFISSQEVMDTLQTL